jgi:hypothetical protein
VQLDQPVHLDQLDQEVLFQDQLDLLGQQVLREQPQILVQLVQLGLLDQLVTMVLQDQLDCREQPQIQEQKVIVDQLDRKVLRVLQGQMEQME